MGQAGHIFINYRRDDTAGFAGRLADSLNEYFGDGRVFRDVDDIQSGANFEEVLKRTAQNADAMIVLIGEHWVTAAHADGRARLLDPDDWVAREISSALERKIPIYPVLVASAVMPRFDELPESLRPLVRYNALSISDDRWQSDVNRLARVVGIDIPGSASERTLDWVQWVVSFALVVSVAGTAGFVARGGFEAVTHTARAARDEAPLSPAVALALAQPLSAAMSGVTFVVISACAVLLLYFAQLVEPARRVYTYAAVLVGLLGTFACFLWFGWLGKDHEGAPIVMFFGSTATAMAMLALAGLSRFKAK